MKKLKKNPVFSYGVIIIAYAIAAVLGVIIGKAMNGALWVNILVADLVSTVIIFVFSVAFSNSSIYDPYWSIQPIVIVFALAFSTKLSVLRFMLIAAVTVWGIRLTGNWAYRFTNLRHEDWRYVSLRRSSGTLFPVVNFACIHLIPTLIVYMCMLPVIIAFSQDTPFSLLSIPFFILSIGAVAMETYADYHMNLFKKDVADGYASGCCRYGLWKHARHPNYLGEILFWWFIFLTVIAAIPSRWYLFFGAFINTLMFLFISIPMTEARMSSKGGFQRYRDQTHLLIPIPRKRS